MIHYETLMPGGGCGSPRLFLVLYVFGVLALELISGLVIIPQVPYSTVHGLECRGLGKVRVRV